MARQYRARRTTVERLTESLGVAQRRLDRALAQRDKVQAKLDILNELCDECVDDIEAHQAALNRLNSNTQ